MPRNERGKEFKKTYQVDEKQNSMDFLEIRLVSIIKDMPDGEVIEFEELFGEIQKDASVVSAKMRNQVLSHVRQRLLNTHKISCLKDGRYIRDEYGILANQEAATIKREEAIQVGERIKKEIEADGEKPTKEKILKRLAEDIKENELYETWITVLCSNGTLLEKEDENDLDR